MASAITAARISSFPFPFYQNTSIHLAPGLWLSPITTHNILEGLVFFCDLSKNKSILREKLISKYFEELCEPSSQTGENHINSHFKSLEMVQRAYTK